MVRFLGIACVLSFLVTNFASATQSKKNYRPLDMKQVRAGLAKLKPFTLKYSDSALSRGEKEVIEILAKAGSLIDEIYLEQLLKENREIFTVLKARWEKDKNAENRDLLQYFWINKSPYDFFSDHRPFLSNVPSPMDPTRNFYPNGLTKEAFEKWIASLSPKKARQAKGDFFRVAGKGPDKLKIEPYAQAYAQWLKPLSKELIKASRKVDTSLSPFLRARAGAFRHNNYEKSESLWIGMNGPKDMKRGNLDITIGPYENYADELNKFKAGFQFYLGVMRPEKTAALQLYGKHVHAMDSHLWKLVQDYTSNGREVAPGVKISKKKEIHAWGRPGEKVTLVAVDLAYASGMANEGIQTLAYNLPNISAWAEKYGTKKVMLMNVLDGKFESILTPIAQKSIRKKDLKWVDGDMFSENTVRHEVAHGIGPSVITVGDKKTTVREQLKNRYSAFEEAKAEIVGLLFGYYLVENGFISDPTYIQRMVTTYVASTFRTVRFGTTSDHAKGKLFEFNRLRQNGGIRYDKKSGSFGVNPTKFRSAVEMLTAEILDLQMHGTETDATKILEKEGKPTPELLKTLARINKDKTIPVDIRVDYTVGKNHSVLK